MAKSNYEVGWGKPPASGRFKKGQSGNPKGRPPKVVGTPQNLTTILCEPVPATIGRRKISMNFYEAHLRSIAKRAIHDHKVNDIVGFIRHCERFDLIARPAALGSQTLYIPKDWDREEFSACLKKYGPPPWPIGPNGGLLGPNSKDPNKDKYNNRLLGFPTEPQRFIKHGKRSDKYLRFSPEALTTLVATELHKVERNGRTVSLTTLELVVDALKQAILAGKHRAVKLYEELVEKYGFGHRRIKGGFIVVDEFVTPEEWSAKYANPAPTGAPLYDGKPGEPYLGLEKK